jgi:leucyl aminopeptidase
MQTGINMDINFKKTINEKASCEIHFIFKKGKEFILSDSAKKVDELTDGAITNTITNNEYKGNFGSGFFITTNKLNSNEALIVSMGDVKKIILNPNSFSETRDENKCKELGGQIYSLLQERGTKGTVSIYADGMGVNIAFGILLKTYNFNKYYTGDKVPKYTKFNLVIQDNNEASANILFQDKNAIAQSIFFTKDLISEPSNVLYPQVYADRVTAMAVDVGLEIKVFGEKELKEIGMNALLSVGQGSARESKVVVMEWMNGGNTKPVALVGKGVCFDTGGYSIKPSKGLKDMKYDMGGSAVVVGTMLSLALRKSKVNAVGVIGLVENMVSSTAYKPGDVIKSLSGQTIEIDNTDAEGRVVLADCLWYTQDKYKPSAMINLATLTGAISIALGDQLAGLFSNNDMLSGQLIKAGEKVDEKVWRLPCDPIGKRYDKYVDSTIADMHNVGKGGEASSTTAAQFLQRFVNETPWAHLDIAGVTWNDKGTMTASGGATGWGIQLLNEWIHNEKL